MTQDKEPLEDFCPLHQRGTSFKKYVDVGLIAFLLGGALGYGHALYIIHFCNF